MCVNKNLFHHYVIFNHKLIANVGHSMLTKKMSFIVFLCLLSISSTCAESSLPYPQSDAVKRQTINLNEIERGLEHQLAITDQPISPQQQALLAQVNQWRKDNPQLQAQFGAVRPDGNPATGSGGACNYSCTVARLRRLARG